MGSSGRFSRSGLARQSFSAVVSTRRIAAIAMWLVLSSLLSCAAVGPQSDAPIVHTPRALGPMSQAPLDETLRRDAHSLLERRCVVCHGCYDAPCQLVLSSLTGLRRGASKTPVYDGSRFFAIEPTRLFIDAQGEAEWRKKGFFSMSAAPTSEAPARNLLVDMLQLKQRHPTPTGASLTESFELDINAKRECPRADEMAKFERDHPPWGMPYALPALRPSEHDTLVRWIEAGAPGRDAPVLTPHESSAVPRWEAFFNQPSNKAQLMARYVYEHLFLASLYFGDEHAADDGATPTFFRLVRSRTEGPRPVDEIATRRPFDDPGQARFYYRIVPRVGVVLSKTHMPYALNDTRMERYRSLFLEPDYRVDRLPSYAPDTSANPFATFAALPVGARYRFMLDEAHFVINGFIKGPVCRGQVALDVIEDRFWITFVSPESPATAREAGLLARSSSDLRLPAEQGSNGALINWRRYARAEKRHLKAKSDYLEQIATSPSMVTLQQIWDGDGHNANAALTVLRHFDNATVVKGLVGGSPETVWVVSYAILERIHSLLVAGFDVFGNIGHQLHTRMYMDFLRMEAEHNFLLLLPKATRAPLVDQWYRDTNQSQKDYVYGKLAHFDRETGIPYRSKTPDLELHGLLVEHLAPVLERKYDLAGEVDPTLRSALSALTELPGRAAARLPELSFLEVTLDDGTARHHTLLRDSAHTNVAHLFREHTRRRPDEDRLTVLRGFVGAYPHALFRVAARDLPAFVQGLRALDDEASYTRLRARFGILRTSADFWTHSDRLLDASRASEPLEGGLFDYNRLEAR